MSAECDELDSHKYKIIRIETIKKAMDAINQINLQLKASELLKVKLQFLLEHKDLQMRCFLLPVCI